MTLVTGPYPTLVSRTAGTLDAFARDTEGDLWWKNYDGSNWGVWTAFPKDIPTPTDTGKYSGWRSSNCDDGYQLQQGPHYWINTAGTITSSFAGATPSGVFIIGLIQGDVPANSTDVLLQFPGTDGNHILYSAVDTVESYLDEFDKAGTKIWIQVESADADVSSLIDIIFTRYGSHPCIIGFGLDGEWYKYSSYSDPDTPGQPFTNAEQTAWVNKLHTYNANYKLFLKHWRPEHMPTSNNTSVVYVSDNAQFADYADMMTKFETWGSTFSTRNVAFQVGYPYDEVNVWSALMPDPMAQIGADLFANISNCVGVYWVDFSIMNVYPPADSYLLPGQPVALVDGSTIHLFRTGYEGLVYTSRYAGATWTDWTSLGDACKVAGYITPSVCQAAAGTLYAFAPNTLGATWYQKYASSAWNANWTTLAGTTWDSVTCFGKSTSAVYVIALQENGTLSERHYNGSSFTAWSNTPFGATAYVAPLVASYDGTYGQVVANVSTGSSRSYTLTGTTWSGPVNESGTTTDLSMFKYGTGTTMAMAVGSDGTVYSMVAAGANFATWVDTGASALADTGASGTIVDSGAYAGLTAAVVGNEGDMWLATYAGAAWGSWVDTGALGAVNGSFTQTVTPGSTTTAIKPSLKVGKTQTADVAATASAPKPTLGVGKILGVPTCTAHPTAPTISTVTTWTQSIVPAATSSAVQPSLGWGEPQTVVPHATTTTPDPTIGVNTTVTAPTDATTSTRKPTIGISNAQTVTPTATTTVTNPTLSGGGGTTQLVVAFGTAAARRPAIGSKRNITAPLATTAASIPSVKIAQTQSVPHATTTTIKPTISKSIGWTQTVTPDCDTHWFSPSTGASLGYTWIQTNTPKCTIRSVTTAVVASNVTINYSGDTSVLTSVVTGDAILCSVEPLIMNYR
jgi:hypothetical protein